MKVSMIDIESMSLLELEETKDMIDIKKDDSLAEYEVIHELRGDECPYCHGHHVIKNGKTKKVSRSSCVWIAIRTLIPRRIVS